MQIMKYFKILKLTYMKHIFAPFHFVTWVYPNETNPKDEEAKEKRGLRPAKLTI